MSDNVLAGLLVGLFIGGILGAMAMAVVATGSKQRFGSSLRVDLLVDLEEVPRSTEVPVTEGDDIDQEMRDLVRRYGRPSGS